jgi:hypothetical protein
MVTLRPARQPWRIRAKSSRCRWAHGICRFAHVNLRAYSRGVLHLRRTARLGVRADRIVALSAPVRACRKRVEESALTSLIRVLRELESRAASVERDPRRRESNRT